MNMNNDDNYNRFFLVPVAILAVIVYLMFCKSVDAKAATTTNGTYYPDLAIEVDWTGYESYKERMLGDNQYIIVCKHNNTTDAVFRYYLMDSPEIPFSGQYINSLPSYYVYTNDYITVKNGVIIECYPDKNHNLSIYAGYGGISDGLYSPIGSNYDYRDSISALQSCPYNNLDYYATSVPTTSVTLDVNGTEYTITEPYPYYFVSYAYDSIRLFFSEKPFTAAYYDIYTLNLYPGQNTVVSYYWNEENTDFLSSRSIYTGMVIQHPAAADYACNYDIAAYTGTGYIYFKQKELVVYPGVNELFDSLPAELLVNPYCIMLRQDSSSAYTNDIVFYSWSDSSAMLMIRWGDSMIRAVKDDAVISDALKARYDIDTGTWIIDDSVAISTCRNDVYSVPYIYFSTTDLYIQKRNQTAWLTDGFIAYDASLENPETSWGWVDDEGELNTGIEWLDGMLTGIGNLFSRLFVPSSGYFTGKVEVLKQKFMFWESIKDTAYVFLNFFETTDFTAPPKITVNLSSAKSKYDYGTSAVFLDLSWYEDYKPAVDGLLSAIMWVVFAWNTFKNLPSILSGIVTAENVSARVGANNLRIENSDMKRRREKTGRWSF